MAKVNFGTLANDVRGKIAGIVYSKNKSGAYTRTKVTPANPRSAFQQAVRAAFGTLAQQWSTMLTEGERAAWAAYSVSYPRRNVFGNSLTLNGLNTFVGMGAVLNQLGLPPAATPPVVGGVDPIIWSPNFGVLTTTTMTLTVATASAAAAAYVYIQATRSLPPGRAATPGDFRFVYSEPDPGPGDIDIYAAYVARFGAPVLGAKVYALASTADGASGLVCVATPFVGIVG
jgi:hypothetical protein